MVSPLPFWMKQKKSFSLHKGWIKVINLCFFYSNHGFEEISFNGLYLKESFARLISLLLLLTGQRRGTHQTEILFMLRWSWKISSIDLSLIPVLPEGCLSVMGRFCTTSNYYTLSGTTSFFTVARLSSVTTKAGHPS